MNHGLTAPRQADANDMLEAEAIRLAQEGDANAFERLYKLYSQQVYGLCLRATDDPTEAEDLTRDIFLRLFREIQRFRGESSLSTCLYQLTVNILLMQLRKKQHPEVSLEAMEPPALKTSGR
jgi:RNA polymerase sigma factor (sigma-70 family)